MCLRHELLNLKTDRIITNNLSIHNNVFLQKSVLKSEELKSVQNLLLLFFYISVSLPSTVLVATVATPIIIWSIAASVVIVTVATPVALVLMMVVVALSAVAVLLMTARARLLRVALASASAVILGCVMPIGSIVMMP